MQLEAHGMGHPFCAHELHVAVHMHLLYMQVDAAAVLETVNDLIACLLMDTPGATLPHQGHEIPYH